MISSISLPFEIRLLAFPEMEVSGVRKSCDMERSRFARNCSFFAKTAARSRSFAFTIPSTASAHSPITEFTMLSSKASIGLFPTKTPIAP